MERNSSGGHPDQLRITDAFNRGLLTLGWLITRTHTDGLTEMSQPFRSSVVGAGLGTPTEGPRGSSNTQEGPAGWIAGCDIFRNPFSAYFSDTPLLCLSVSDDF